MPGTFHMRCLHIPVVVAAAFLCLCAESAQKTCRVTCGGAYPYHLQGVATDGTNLYWSFTTALVKTDLSGSVIATNSHPHTISDGHMGDLCLKDGKLFVGMNFGKGSDGARKGDAVWVYDTETMERVASHPTPEPAWCNNGVEWFEGSFWVITSAPRHSEYNYLYEYTPDFRYRTCVLVRSGWTNLGVQTICRVGDAVYIGCYGSNDDKESPHKSCTIRVDGRRLLAAARGRGAKPVEADWRRDVNTAEGMFVLDGKVWECHSVLLSCAADGRKTWTAQAFPAKGLDMN